MAGYCPIDGDLLLEAPSSVVVAAGCLLYTSFPVSRHALPQGVIRIRSIPAQIRLFTAQGKNLPDDGFRIACSRGDGLETVSYTHLCTGTEGEETFRVSPLFPS